MWSHKRLAKIALQQNLITDKAMVFSWNTCTWGTAAFFNTDFHSYLNVLSSFETYRSVDAIWNIFFSFDFYVYLLLAVLIFHILFSRIYKTRNPMDDILSDSEFEEVLQAWNPEKIIGPDQLSEIVHRIDPVITESKGVYLTVDGVSAVNFASFDFLGFSGEDTIKNDSEEAIRKYGVGSCGPRGFYGTMDVHLELEEKLPHFVGAEAGMIYSYDLSTPASIIPVFLKRGDVIIYDEAVSYPILSGISVSKADSFFFRHNDIDHLQDVIIQANEKYDKINRKNLNRRFIIIEGLYQNTGCISPLVQILQIAEHFKYRIYLEESMSIGVLGTRGKGSCEHHGVDINEITIVSGSMATSFASFGGYAVGGKALIAHKKLSSSGYCFSASLPPFQARAVCSGIKILEETPQRVEKLRSNSIYMHRALESMFARHDTNPFIVDKMHLIGDKISPIKHLFLVNGLGNRKSDVCILQGICDIVLDDASYAIIVSDYSPLQKRTQKPSLRLTVSYSHTNTQIDGVVEALEHALDVLFSDLK